MSYAFASIVQARPCPTFGRPVHQRGGPLDYGPVLLLKPFRFHLAVDTLSSECLPTELRSFPLAVKHRFRSGARLGFSLFESRPVRHYSHLWIWHSSSECQRDFNPPDLGAAQRTL